MDACLSTTQSSFLSESEDSLVTPTERWSQNQESSQDLQDRTSSTFFGAQPFCTPREFRSLSTKSTQAFARSLDSLSSFSNTSHLQTPDEIKSRLSENATQSSPISLLLPKPFVSTPSRKNLTVSAAGLLFENSESTQKSTENRASLFDARNPSYLRTTSTTQNSPNSSEKTLESCESTERTQCETFFGQQSFGTRSTQRSSIFCRHYSLADSTQDTLYSPDNVSSSSSPSVCSRKFCPECHKAWNQFRLKGYNKAKVSIAEKATQTSESLQIQDDGLNSRDFWQKILYERTRNQHKPVHSVTIHTEDIFYPIRHKQRPFSNLRKRIDKSVTVKSVSENTKNPENLPRTSTNKLWVNYIRYLCQRDFRLKTDPRYESEIVRNFQEFLRQPLDLSPTELAVCQKKFGPFYTFDQVTSFLNQIQHGEEWMMMIGRRNRKEGTCDQRSKGDFVIPAQTNVPAVAENLRYAREKETEPRNSEIEWSIYQTSSKTIENLSSSLFPTEPQISHTPRFDGTDGKNLTKTRVAGQGGGFSSRKGSQSAPTTPLLFGGIRSLSKPKLTPRSNKTDQLRARAIQEKAKKRISDSVFL